MELMGCYAGWGVSALLCMFIIAISVASCIDKCVAGECCKPAYIPISGSAIELDKNV